ncbi:MAG: heavy metal translocating P-type ATPase [Ascidiaceihabitans sp.]|nr:heavy metal translocating P-type ATPase [Ascidiaceihabitans sp.]
MTLAACPACDVAPLAQDIAARDVKDANIVLSLPGIHCAACIGTVERTLLASKEVKNARVNLSRKRVTIDAPDLGADTLIKMLADVGYEANELNASLLGDAETDTAGRALLVRLAVAGFAMMNVMLFSVAVWSGAAEATQGIFHWISASIAIPALLFSAQVFFSNAWTALRVGRLNMDVPISLAIILAGGMSVYETAFGGAHVYFDAALSLTFFLLVGRYLDHRTRMAARSAAQELSALEVPRTTKLIAGQHHTVNVADVQIDDKIVVMVGMRVPVDGQVVAGQSETDRSFLTGESLPISIHTGDMIAAGEVNLTGPITLRVTAVGEDTTLRRMAALVETAEGAKNRYTALADRAAQIYAPAVHLLALATFAGWILVSGDMVRSLNVAISVLIITCPCALGLAVPAVMTAASGRLFRRGLLVKNGTALERLAEVDSIVFDKTGTLTEGHARIDLHQLNADQKCVLAALSAASSHPVSRAISAAIPNDTVMAKLTDIREISGAGVEANWAGKPFRLGRAEWVGASGSPAFSIGEDAPVILSFSETLRDGAKDAVGKLHAAGFNLHILSGDAQAPVAKLGAALGISQVQADMRPQDKLDRVKQLEATGKRVLMVGDGLNDTAALTQAHASISPASALDASRTASDIVLLGRSLIEIPDAIKTAKSARARVIENFAIAAGYNMIAIPIAVMGFATPLAAAIAMSASSITVLLNALRVR